MVFQQFNLFPHLSVKENITLAPIWVKKMPKAEAEELAMQQLEIVKIPEQADKYPWSIIWRTTTKSCNSKITCNETKYYAF